MPESKRYIVTVTTEVEVHAEDEEQAMRRADLRFMNPTQDYGSGSVPRRMSTSIVYKKPGER